MTSYKSHLIGVKTGRYGPPPTVGWILASNWSATARLKPSSPRPIRCRPATVRLSQWVLETRLPTRKADGYSAPRTVFINVSNQNRRPLSAIKLASWNVRTMCPGMTDNPQQVNDARKTAIIDRELKRLNIDIAALQETRLPENGSIREQKTTPSFGKVKGSLILAYTGLDSPLTTLSYRTSSLLRRVPSVS